MVLTSISTLSSSSPFLSHSPSTPTSTLFRTSTFPPFLVGFPKPPFSNASLRLKASSFSASPTQQDNGSPEQFLKNNSTADFLRYKKEIDGATHVLQTSIVSYNRKSTESLLNPFPQVDLVSTIHLADKEYFAALQKKLESYDCVLYEMVASKKTVENHSSDDILQFIPGQMAQIIGFDLQLYCLNYETENWENADLDCETFKLLQDAKGESILSFAKDMARRSKKAKLQPSIPKDLDPWRSKLLWAERVLPMPLVVRVLIKSACENVGSPVSGYPEIEALLRLDFMGSMKLSFLKRLMSKLSIAGGDVEGKSVIIGERNRVAIEALRKALDKGNNRIAILYGAGHMPDLGRRLREEFDLTPSGVEWITAWSIRSSLPFLKPLNHYQILALLFFLSILALDLWFWKLLFRTIVGWVISRFR